MRQNSVYQDGGLVVKRKRELSATPTQSVRHQRMGALRPHRQQRSGERPADRSLRFARQPIGRHTQGEEGVPSRDPAIPRATQPGWRLDQSDPVEPYH